MSLLAFSHLRAILFPAFFLLKSGEMAERSKAAVSKTVNGFFPFGGSNPPLSAIFMPGFQASFLIFPLTKKHPAPDRVRMPDEIAVRVWNFVLKGSVTDSRQGTLSVPFVPPVHVRAVLSCTWVRRLGG